MTMILRVDTAEHVVRSVGDPPNGVLGTGHASDGDGYALGISSSWEPPPGKPPLPPGSAVAVPDDAGEFQPVPVRELVAACESPAVVYWLWMAAAVLCASEAQALPQTLNPEGLRKAVELLGELHDELAEAGFIRPG